MKTSTVRILFLVTSLLFSISLGQDSDKLRQEESENYYKKWLEEDVVYIISDDEQEVFFKLTTDEEREQFIEQFWRRRDTDLKTPFNEFKEEHYRRIAYANERFSSGISGWKTDRGRIYIAHGPPLQITEYTGGTYERPQYEGGGTTSTFPFQVWRYRRIEGLGEDIELEFVDTTLTGDYHLTHDPWEKDAFANVPGIGLTEAEAKGLATKVDRFVNQGGGRYYPLMAIRNQDLPFPRFERYVGIQRPPELKYDDMKSQVDVDISYQTLPFRFHQDSFRLNDTHCIVPITVELSNESLTYTEQNGHRVAKVAIYGAVTSMGKLILKEFEEELLTSFSEQRFQEGLQGKSLYQKMIVLEKGERVKLDLVVKDLNSDKVGVSTRMILPPDYGEENLAASSLILSNSIQVMENAAEADEMFVLGNVKIRPSLDRVFPTDRLMGAYVQLYNVGIDQQTFEPSLTVKYRLSHEGQNLVELVDEQGESIQFYSGQRVVLTRFFSPERLGPGKYHLQIEVIDRILNQMAMVGDSFEVVASSAAN
ncbi:MAG: GWxTD domain-containing protein [Acidobacteriota bacterium]|nr:MAG: GWxTD domain-containing protein [Acidobacteriota bacterium]